jgi:flagellar hook-length control protein FliK
LRKEVKRRMNMVNLFKLGTVEKQAKTSVSSKGKNLNKKQFDQVFQNLKKQDVADQNPKKQPVSNSFNKLGHVIKKQAEVVKQEHKPSHVKLELKRNVNDDFITKINHVVDQVFQVQQRIEALNRVSSTNEQGNETEQSLANEVLTLLDGLKELAEEVPLIQEMLGNLQMQGLNSLITQVMAADSLETVENPDINLSSIIGNRLTEKVNGVIPQELLNQLKGLGTDGSLNNISEAIKNLNNSFANLQLTAEALAIKANGGNPLLQEVLAKLNATTLELQPAIDLMVKFPSFLANLQNTKVKLEDIEVTDESLLAVTDAEGREQREATKTLTNQDLTKFKVQIDSKMVTDEKGLKARSLDSEVTNDTDQSNLVFSSLVQTKQANNLQELQRLSQIQANATKGLGGNVVDQLVQKASLMIKENFSEMNIQLTPENLGKVDLKISIERGIVVAKFAAESQQVKELIESNLTNLKQQLTNQGLKVDQLSVTVGQQSFEQSQGNPYQQANFKPSSKSLKVADGEEYQGVLAEEVQDVTRRYYSDNEVDYTA